MEAYHAVEIAAHDLAPRGKLELFENYDTGHEHSWQVALCHTLF